MDLCKTAFLALAMIILSVLYPAHSAAKEETGGRVLLLSAHIGELYYSAEYHDLFMKDFAKRWGKKVELLHFSPEELADSEATAQKIKDAAKRPDIKALILINAPKGSAAALKSLRNAQSGLLTLVSDPDEDMQTIAASADLTVSLNHGAIAYVNTVLAKRMGAKRIIIFSLPKHLSDVNYGRQYRVMSAASHDLGLVLSSDLTCPDPEDPKHDQADVERYLEQAVSRSLKTYGPQTAFMATGHIQNKLLTPIVLRNGGFLIGSNFSSPLQGLPEVLDLVEEARLYFGKWKRLLSVEDEKYMRIMPPGQMAFWPFPYEHTMAAAITEMAVNITGSEDKKPDLDQLADLLAKHSQPVKWQLRRVIDHASGRPVPSAFLVYQDSYWMGHGYQGSTKINIPSKYLEIH